MRAQVGSFCLVATGVFIVAEILLLYAGFKYSYRCGTSSHLRMKTSFLMFASLA
jgi:H+-transporting ATPase